MCSILEREERVCRDQTISLLSTTENNSLGPDRMDRTSIVCHVSTSVVRKTIEISFHPIGSEIILPGANHVTLLNG